MGKELFESLIEEEKVELIYSNTRLAGEKTFINYTIICDVYSATEDIKLLEKIIATMYIIKELFAKHNISFSYTVKTSEEFEQELANNHHKLLKQLANVEILYSKDNYYEDILSEREQYKKSTRAK